MNKFTRFIDDMFAKYDPDHTNDCAAGIHFVETIDQAINWGNANFGCLTAY